VTIPRATQRIEGGCFLPVSCPESLIGGPSKATYRSLVSGGDWPHFGRESIADIVNANWSRKLEAAALEVVLLFEEKSSLPDIGDFAFAGATISGMRPFLGFCPFCGDLRVVQCLRPPAVEPLVLPIGLTNIGDSCFFFSTVSRIDLPSSVTQIGSAAFANTSSLRQVTLGSSVSYISDYAFFCSRLVEVAVPDCVQTVGYRAFFGCIHLRSLLFGELSRLRVIERFAFTGSGIIAL
jgi:hypothetical protein